MAFGDRHLAFMTTGVHSSAVTFGAQSCRGILDIGERLVVEDGVEMQVRLPALTVSADALAGVADGSSLTVAGVAYYVRSIEPSLDGLAVTYHLARA